MEATQRRSQQLGRADGIETNARALLESHSHFVGRTRLFEFECIEAVLVVRGTVPSYYLKQVLQSALKQLKGVQIDNQVRVVSMEANAYADLDE